MDVKIFKCVSAPTVFEVVLKTGELVRWDVDG